MEQRLGHPKRSRKPRARVSPQLTHQSGMTSGRLTRRDVLRLAGTTMLALPVLGQVGCSWSEEERKFFVDHVFSWEPKGFFSDLAFAVIEPAAEYALDYLDIDCPNCGLAFRVFLYSVELGSLFVVTCPECALSVRASVAVSKFLVSQLSSYAMSRAVAFVVGDGYEVNRVGPAETRAGTLQIARSAACYAVRDREPVGHFNREIAAIPRKINYYTEVRGARSAACVYHVWRRNGAVTDRIRLHVGSDRWRTWTRKRNLAPGPWILTTETEGGAVLDVREFSIAA